MVFTRVFNLSFVFLPILSISSPVFCEFVLELGGLPFQFGGPYREGRNRWGGTDRFLEQGFARHGDFKLIIRTPKFRDLGDFQVHAKEAFPLLESRGCIHFEISHSTGKC